MLSETYLCSIINRYFRNSRIFTDERLTRRYAIVNKSFLSWISQHIGFLHPCCISIHWKNLVVGSRSRSLDEESRSQDTRSPGPADRRSCQHKAWRRRRHRAGSRSCTAGSCQRAGERRRRQRGWGSPGGRNFSEPAAAGCSRAPPAAAEEGCPQPAPHGWLPQHQER